jgi:hypothetical protein
MKYFMISVIWSKGNAEPVCLASNKDNGLAWSKRKILERGLGDQKLEVFEYDEPIEEFGGIIPL